MPFYQGTMDGLCGLYALVNAYEACGVEKKGDLEHVFKLACDTLPRRRWPDVLWDGTSFQDLKKMICRCEKAMGNKGDSPIIAEFPFEGNDPGSDELYWKYFDRAFSCEDTGVWDCRLGDTFKSLDCNRTGQQETCLVHGFRWRPRLGLQNERIVLACGTAKK